MPHKIPLDCTNSDETDSYSKVSVVVLKFLDEQYQQSLQLVTFELVPYQPSESFTQIGLVSKTKLKSGCFINGLVRFLKALPDSDNIAGVNDISLTTRITDLKTTHLMIGPLSFINSSCTSNSKYDIKVVRCLANTDIKVGEQITFKNDSNFFGNFNEFCLCKHKLRHANPLEDEIPKPKRIQRRKVENSFDNRRLLSQQKKKKLCKKNVLVDIRYRFKRNVIVFESEDSTSESSEGEFSKILYEELYGSLQLETSFGSSRDADNSVSGNFVPESPMTCVNPPVCSTPLRNAEPFCLKIFEEQIDENDNDEKYFADESFENAEIELFDGSDFSSNDFCEKFNEIDNQYKLQNIARKNLPILFSRFLSSPNILRVPMQKEHLPSTTVFKDGGSTFVAIQLLPQFKKNLSQNSEFIKKLWQSDCKWSFGKTAIK